MFSQNPHYHCLEECLINEAASILQWQENRELTVKNAQLMCMNDDEYRQFLDDFYFASETERIALMWICIQGIASNSEAVILISQIRSLSQKAL